MPWRRIEAPVGPRGFTFEGQMVVSPLTRLVLSESDIEEIRGLLAAFIEEEGEADFLQVFVNDDMQMIAFCVDSLRAAVRHMISEEQRSKRDRWFMVLPPEVKYHKVELEDN